ncbi:MAG: hypothetical protein LBG94_06120, partial [Treponema sp.]|nr:hypothetical protein [Treponema sp.]
QVFIRNREGIANNKEVKAGGSRREKLSGAEFLEQYRNDIAALPEAKSGEYYLSILNKKESQIFTTLLPFAAAMKKQNTALKQKDLIEEVKTQSIKKIEKVLNSACPQSRLVYGQTAAFSH